MERSAGLDTAPNAARKTRDRQDTVTPTAAEDHAAGRRAGAVLAVTSAVVLMDATIVNVAFETIGRSRTTTPGPDRDRHDPTEFI